MGHFKTSNVPKKNSVEYPTLTQIKNASTTQIRIWYNGGLPLPDMKNEDQVEAMKLIIKRNRDIRKDLQNQHP